MNILIADHNELTRNSLAMHFVQSGYHVECLETGADVCRHLREHSVDVLLCALHLPEQGGLALVEKLQMFNDFTPVIMFADDPSVQELIYLFKLPVFDFFLTSTTLDFVQLEERVLRVVSNVEKNKDRLQLQHLNQQLEKNLKQLQVDLQAGHYVQKKMLPETPKVFGNYTFSHRLLASSYLSGDFVEYVSVGDEYVCFFIADVSGHGASSAFITVLLKNITARLRSAWIHDKDFSIASPANFLRMVNQEFIALESGKHATLFVGLLNIVTGQLRYSMAGHHPLPIIKTPKQAYYLDVQGKPVGLFPEYSVQEETLQLDEGCCMFLFSDGILDTLPAGTMLEKERILIDNIASYDVNSIEQLCQVLNLDEQDKLLDDVTMLVLNHHSQ